MIAIPSKHFQMDLKLVVPHGSRAKMFSVQYCRGSNLISKKLCHSYSSSKKTAARTYLSVRTKISDKSISICWTEKAVEALWTSPHILTLLPTNIPTAFEAVKGSCPKQSVCHEPSSVICQHASGFDKVDDWPWILLVCLPIVYHWRHWIRRHTEIDERMHDDSHRGTEAGSLCKPGHGNARTYVWKGALWRHLLAHRMIISRIFSQETLQPSAFYGEQSVQVDREVLWDLCSNLVVAYEIGSRQRNLCVIIVDISRCICEVEDVIQPAFVFPACSV